MKKILISLAMIVVVGAAVAGGTAAFYNDTETSTGNIFVAGTVNLTVDSYGSTYNDGDILDSSFQATDLTDEKFFDFEDVKPADYGWRHISLHVDDNPAWACLLISDKEDDENTVYDPELEAEDTTDDGVPNGELSSDLEIFVWEDLNPDGKYDPDNEIALMDAPDSFFNVDYVTYSDSNSGASYINGFGDVRNIGSAWCAGTLVIDEDGDVIDPGLPGSTITCDGSGMGNIAQSDEFEASLTLYAEQIRNNDNFLCSEVDLDDEEEGNQPS